MNAPFIIMRPGSYKSLPHAARLACPQRGQALVFALFTSVLVILALFAMFSMGGQTVEKIKLQNTADAAVYSAAQAEARDYNFSAYTNRAMIANQVGVAQFVGLTSWFRNLSSFTNNNDSANFGRSVLYELMMKIWSGGMLKPLYTTVYKGIGAVAGIFDEGKLGSTFMKGAITLLDGLIRVYSESQRIYHYSTALTVAQTLGVFDTLGQALDNMLGVTLFNGPLAILDGGGSIIKANDEKVRLTSSSAFYLGYHYYKWFGFTEFKNPNLDSGGDGDNAERFAQVTTDSLDDFSRDRSTKPAWGFAFFYAPPLTFVDPTVFIPYTSGPLFLPVIHRGGTELKVTNDAGTGAPAGTGGGTGATGVDCHGNPVSSSSTPLVVNYHNELPTASYTGCDGDTGTVQKGDAAHPAGAYAFNANQWVDTRCFGTTPPAGCPTTTRTRTPASPANGDAHPGGPGSKSKRSWTALDASSFAGIDIFWISILGIPIPLPIPFVPPWIPVAHGAAQSGKQLSRPDVLSGSNNFGHDASNSYGDSLSSWTTKISAAMQQEKGAGTSLTLSPNTFGGLTQYMDVKDIAADNLTGPPLVIEIEKDVSDMLKGPGVGQFATDNGAPVRKLDSKGKMRSLSKAQVYFSRPTSGSGITGLDWFKRTIGSEGATELGSLYNPYWQARLVPNSFIEQYISMEIQRAGLL